MSGPSDVAGSVIKFVLERLSNSVKRQIGFVTRYGSNLQNIRGQVQTLGALKSDVQTEVNDADEKGEKIKDEVFDWQANAIQIELKAETWEEKINKNSGCCHAWRLDWCFRRGFSIDAEEMAGKIKELQERRREIGSVFLPVHIPPVIAIPTSDFVLLEASKTKINEIMGLLKDETHNISIIGVYGMGGTGKSTLIREVARQAGEEKLFDKVVIADVTENPNKKMIQNTIAEYFGFKIEEEEKNPRRDRLFERLMKQKGKVLIILDDLWDRLDLGDIGIPHGNDNKGCKIIVTSRSIHVCKKMETDKDVQIKELSEPDALLLFKEKAGLREAPDLDEAAKMVIDNCGRLPNAIVIVGWALRNEPISQWNAIIQRGRESNSLDIKGIPEEMVLAVTVGYGKLTPEDHSCLLFCCLFPTYYSVSMEELAIFALADTLFHGVGSLGEVRIRMDELVDHLKTSNFLLRSDREGCYTVHDDIRKVVKFIASRRGENIVANAGQRLTEWPAEECKSSKRISLMDSDITLLPHQPVCPQLLTLFLQNNDVKEIPTDFFKQMTTLTYLDMSYTSISSLPWSLCRLVNLHSLRLENTHLQDASLLGRLNKLKVLILRGSCVEQFPDGLEKLTDLKILDLSNNLYLQGIPANVISKLSRLEDLCIGNSFGEWEVEGTRNPSEANFFEVASLALLNVLHIHVKSTKALVIDFDGPWGNLRKFCVCVNDDYWDISSERSMYLKNLSYPVANWVKQLLEKTEHLALVHSRDLENIVQNDIQALHELKTLHLRACNIHHIFKSSSFAKVEKLEELHVEYCYPMEEVFYLEDIEEEHANLTRLRELILVGLPKLEAIWEGNLSAAHLENLKLIKVKECRKLRNLFPKTFALKIHQLEHLAIMNCDNMREIVSNEQAEMEQEAADNMISSTIPPPVLFKNLQKLVISKCKNMKSILGLRLARGLEHLQELAIASCNQVEEIISKGEEKEEEDDQNMLPRLKKLALLNLPNLHTLYKGELLLKWPTLDELQVWNCPNLKTLPLDLDGAPELQKFKGQMEWFENLEWKYEITKTRLRRLLTEED